MSKCRANSATLPTRSLRSCGQRATRAVNRSFGAISLTANSRRKASRRSFFLSNSNRVKMLRWTGCAVSVHMQYPCNTGEEGGNEPLGHPTDLERKRKGENSMLETRRTLEG